MQNVKQQILDTLFVAQAQLQSAHCDADLLTATANANVLAELQDKFNAVADAVSYYLD